MPLEDPVNRRGGLKLGPAFLIQIRVVICLWFMAETLEYDVYCIRKEILRIMRLV